MFRYTINGVSYVVVECLTPLSRVWSDPRGQAALVVQILEPELQSPRLGVLGPPPWVEGGPAPSWRGLLLGSLRRAWRIKVLGMSLVRDILKDNAADRLLEACSRPPWLISREDLSVWFPCIRREGPVIAQNAQVTWRLQPAGQDGPQQLVVRWGWK